MEMGHIEICICSIMIDKRVPVLSEPPDSRVACALGLSLISTGPGLPLSWPPHGGGGHVRRHIRLKKSKSVGAHSSRSKS